ncbi:hypothetical protein BRD56_00105 [Thermoplasmatales archaeon SW_10_69_26]|nr:MAG: hypothetical protein BRD56_00105 [Thermoplasmatales archaeon SW_10_69_26]
MTVPIVQVDAFANLPFTGNPAAVTLLEEEPSASWMQRLAAEMNLSETAFLWPEDEGYGLRWFTPETEVDLCGHATLAAAHVLFESGRVDEEETITFATDSGPVECEQDEPWIRMAFPSHPPYSREEDAGRVAQALDQKPTWVGENRLDRFAVLDEETAVRQLEVDLDAVRQLGGRGLIVTAPADDESEVDFVSRFFAPSAGVDEDPVTGSAHCALGPYWANRLDQSEVVGRQVSKRGGMVRVRVTDEGVDLEGQAVTVFDAELREIAEP